MIVWTTGGEPMARFILAVSASSGTFRMPPLSSLVNETAMLDAQRVAELALPALLNTQ